MRVLGVGVVMGVCALAMGCGLGEPGDHLGEVGFPLATNNAQRRFNKNYLKWKRARVRDYTARYDAPWCPDGGGANTCGGCVHVRAPVILEVEEGEAKRTRDVETRALIEEIMVSPEQAQWRAEHPSYAWSDGYPTVDEAFLLVASSIRFYDRDSGERDAEECVKVRYHPVYGFPEFLSEPCSTGPTHFEFSDFQPTP